jgi:3-hydroxyisobutyrate dehydrogenase-like beta-hydroxyacid dehydrogenase
LATAKNHDYSPQFPVRLMHKDFGLVLAAAARFGLSMPATEASAAINSEEAASGNEEDFSAVIRWMEQLAKSKTLCRRQLSKYDILLN